MANNTVNDDIFNTFKPLSIEKKFCFKKVLQNSRKDSAHKDNQTTNISLSLKNFESNDKFSTFDSVNCKNTLKPLSSLSCPTIVNKKQYTASSTNVRSNTSKSPCSTSVHTTSSEKPVVKQLHTNSNFTFRNDVASKNVLSNSFSSNYKPATYSSLKVEATKAKPVNQSPKATAREKQTTRFGNIETKNRLSCKKISDKTIVEQQSNAEKQFTLKKSTISEKQEPSNSVSLWKEFKNTSCNSRHNTPEVQIKETKKFKFKKCDDNVMYDLEKIFSKTLDTTPLKNSPASGSNSTYQSVNSASSENSLETTTLNYSTEYRSSSINRTPSATFSIKSDFVNKISVADSRTMCYKDASVDSTNDEVFNTVKQLNTKSTEVLHQNNSSAFDNSKLWFKSASASTSKNISSIFETKECNGSIANTEKVSNT